MIEIKNLTKRFQDFTALENVTCTIGSGCIYGMVGSNGAGKSTFLRTLTGVYQPDGGEIRIDGQPMVTTGADGAAVFRWLCRCMEKTSGG